MDTNDLVSVDRVFHHKHVAEQYINIQSEKNKALDYFIREREILEDVNQVI
jgi:hypothetical protein